VVVNSDVRASVRHAGDHPALQQAARTGYAVSGVLHLLVGWIALQLAWGASSSTADQSGALGQLAGNGLGRVLLWVAVAGFLGLALWQVAEAVGAHEGHWHAAKAAAKAVVYAVLAWTTFTFARGGSSDSEEQTSDATAMLMGLPFGTVLVGAVGLAVLAVGAYHLHKGVAKTFLEDLANHPGPLLVRAGMFGYGAKGVALGVVGVLFALAAVRHDPEQADGLDGALRTLLEAPFGPALLTVVGLGLVAFGGYSFGRARHARV
jgi:hypothetical protein